MSSDDIVFESVKREPAKPLNVDMKRVLFRALRYWYVFLLSIFLSLTYFVLKTRYAARIYPVTASILIKQKEETSEGKLLYNNPLVSGFRNYQNELYLLRSYPLIQRTLEELNFGVAFYNEGNVLTTEIYDPQIKVAVLKNAGDHRFYVKLLNDRYFQLAENKESFSGNKFAFGDSIQYAGLSFVFFFNPNSTARIEVNQTIVFSYTDPNNLAGGYVGNLQAAWAEEGAGVINLSINGPNPSKDIDFLNGLVREYQRYDLDKKNQVASRTIDFINGQLAVITDSLHVAERRLERFKDQNLVTDISKEAERLYEKMGAVEEQRTELIIRKSYYRYLLEYLKNDSGLDKIILPTSVGINDPVLASLISKLIDLQLNLKWQNAAENPIVVDHRKKIVELKKDILESVKNQQNTDKIKDDYIVSQIKLVEKQLNTLPSAERKLVSIQRNYSLLENLYIFLLQKRAEAGISRASTTTDISVVNPPMQSGGAISPKPFQNYMLGAIIGLGLPALLFILLELFNSKVQSKEDVEKVSSIPFIGGVGHKSGDNNLEVLVNPKNSISESFRALRSDLNYFLGKREKAIIVITSSISGEGKTFTSINLASVISLSGKKTLIVGADMRKPKLFADFKLMNDVGLSSYLSGIMDFENIVQKTAFSNLDLVSGGPVPPNPSELLLTDRMSEFLKEAKEAYDYIIIDTPPLAIVSDAFAFSEFADHSLFVIRQNYTPISMLRSLEDAFRSGKLKNISILLNDIHISGPGYGYGYGYGYWYGYSDKKYGDGYYS